MTTLSQMLSARKLSPVDAAQQKSYVVYTLPYQQSSQENESSIAILESRGLISGFGTTGLRTWEAALHLGAYLCSLGRLNPIRGKRILELGAGTGFLSILCLKYLQANYVFATDGDPGVVDDIETNAMLNEMSTSNVFATSVLKWGHTLSGGEEGITAKASQLDIVVGADVVSLGCLFTRSSRS